MKIYISIPITGHDLKTQAGKAMEIAEKIKALGHEPVDPFDTLIAPHEMTEKEKYAYYMGEDIKCLLMCDAVYFCDGWMSSNGCNAKYQIARIYGLKTIYGGIDLYLVDNDLLTSKLTRSASK